VSCGDDAGQECAEVVQRVFQFLDGDIERRSEAYAAGGAAGAFTYTRIERHIDECVGCEGDYAAAVEQLESALVLAVERSCHTDRASAELLERIRGRLADIRSQEEPHRTR
jgi:hypothetical protein